jgi:hypothetical protein
LGHTSPLAENVPGGWVGLQPVQARMRSTRQVITIPREGYEALLSAVRTDDLEIIGWGELYRTQDAGRCGASCVRVRDDESLGFAGRIVSRESNGRRAIRGRSAIASRRTGRWVLYQMRITAFLIVAGARAGGG